MKWEDYKSKKLKNPDFKKAYDELEEEFNLLNDKLTAENKKILTVSNEESFNQITREFPRFYKRWDESRLTKQTTQSKLKK